MSPHAHLLAASPPTATVVTVKPDAAENVFKWTGEVDDLAPILHRVRASGSYATKAGEAQHHFAVPTRADYEDRLRRAGALPRDEALESRPDLVAVVQAHWHAAGHNGCLSASFMSEQRAKYGWETWVIGSTGEAATDAAAIRGVVAPRIPDADAQVVSVLLPLLQTPGQLAEIFAELAGDEAWRFEDHGVEQDPELGAVVRLGLTVDVGDEHWSEVLGFGPGAPLAYTRRAPFMELAIRTKPPAEPEPDHRSFMANIDIDLDKPLFAEYWRETKRQRAARLGDAHTVRGKARVTTIVPLAAHKPQVANDEEN